MSLSCGRSWVRPARSGPCAGWGTRPMVADKSRRAGALWVRVTAFGLAVAGVMALVAGLVSVRMVSTASRDATRETLADQADVVAAQLSDVRIAAPRVTEILSGQGISLVRVGAGGAVIGADQQAV